MIKDAEDKGLITPGKVGNKKFTISTDVFLVCNADFAYLIFILYPPYQLCLLLWLVGLLQ